VQKKRRIYCDKREKLQETLFLESFFNLVTWDFFFYLIQRSQVIFALYEAIGIAGGPTTFVKRRSPNSPPAQLDRSCAGLSRAHTPPHHPRPKQWRVELS